MNFQCCFAVKNVARLHRQKARIIYFEFGLDYSVSILCQNRKQFWQLCETENCAEFYLFLFDNFQLAKQLRLINTICFN